MRQIVYAMRFTGQATPVGPIGNVLRASTTSLWSTSITSRGLQWSGLHPGGAAGRRGLRLRVTFTSESDFLRQAPSALATATSALFDDW